MLLHPCANIIRLPDIERAIAPVRDNINTEHFMNIKYPYEICKIELNPRLKPPKPTLFLKSSEMYPPLPICPYIQTRSFGLGQVGRHLLSRETVFGIIAALVDPIAGGSSQVSCLV